MDSTLAIQLIQTMLRGLLSAFKEVIIFLAPLSVGTGAVIRYNIFDGPDFGLVRLSLLSALFTTSSPFFKRTEPEARAAVWSDSSVKICIGEGLPYKIADLLGHFALVTLLGSYYFVSFTVSRNVCAAVCALFGVVLAALLYLSFHLYILPSNSGVPFWVSVEVQLFHWTMFLGMLLGTYASQLLPFYFIQQLTAISSNRSWRYIGLRTLILTSGLVAPSIWLRSIKQRYASHSAIFDAMRDNKGFFLSAVAHALIWASCIVLLLASLWPSFHGRRIFGTALLTLLTLIILWRPTPFYEHDSKSMVFVEDGKLSALSQQLDWKGLVCGNNLSLQIVFALYWTGVAGASLTSVVTRSSKQVLISDSVNQKIQPSAAQQLSF